MQNIHEKAREFLSNEKLGLFFSNEKKRAIFLFADWVSEQADGAKRPRKSNDNSSGNGARKAANANRPRKKI